MGISVADNFNIKMKKPLDNRTTYATLAQMKEVADNDMYEGCEAYCIETDKYYKFLSSNSVDATTGKWRERQSGGGEDENAYHTTDSAETDIADNDYFPFQDISVNVKKKSLWSNIKDKLKAYFDTIYDLNKNDIPMYATCSTGASTTGKTATVSRGTFKLVAGAKVSVKFSYGNTASQPTLNINSTGAQYIRIRDNDGTLLYPSTWWGANDVVTFIYDGSYFIMQPSYSALPSIPVVGTMSKSDLYSTTEKVVGMWQDGRPLYQKTIHFGAFPTSATTKTVAHGISNLREVVEGIWYQASGTGDSAIFSSVPYVQGDTIQDVSWYVNNGNVCIVTYTSKEAITESYVTLRYTKTTDSANSYNYANENDYSTSEKIVGKWIDGSYLYQKTITGTTNSSQDATLVTGTTGFNIVSIKGVLSYDSTSISGGKLTIPYYANSNEWVVAYTENNKLYISTKYHSKYYAITIQYTK